MHVGCGEAGESCFHITAGDGQSQLPVGNVFDAIDTTGKDAVVHSRLARDGTQQWRVSRFALECQAHDTARHVSEVIGTRCNYWGIRGFHL